MNYEQQKERLVDRAEHFRQAIYKESRSDVSFMYSMYLAMVTEIGEPIDDAFSQKLMEIEN